MKGIPASGTNNNKEVKGSINIDGSSRKKVLITSLLFMGLSHILYFKQYIKGAIFALLEVIFILLTPWMITKLTDMVTLGTLKTNLPVKLRDNSVFMLIDGIILIAVIFIFIAIYVISVKGALSEYKDFCREEGRIKGIKESLLNVQDKAFTILGLTPTVLLVLFFVVVPIVFSIAVAFTNYSAPEHIPPNNTVDWVGFANFKAMFGGSATWTGAFGRVAIWTLLWAFLATSTCYFGGMLMAVILKDSKLKIAPVFRSIFILPYAVPAALSMLVWNNLLNGTFGTVNRTLMALGVIDNVIPWLSNDILAKFMVVLINLWAGFPYFMLLITGTMTAISEDMYEAARIDGASKFQLFKSITLPLVLYQTTPLIIMSFTHNINNFGAIFFLTGGSPVVSDSTITSAGGTDILVTWMYKLTITLLKYNYASAIAVVIFIVLVPFAIFNFRRTKSYKEGEL